MVEGDGFGFSAVVVKFLAPDNGFLSRLGAFEVRVMFGGAVAADRDGLGHIRIGVGLGGAYGGFIGGVIIIVSINVIDGVVSLISGCSVAFLSTFSFGIFIIGQGFFLEIIFIGQVR